MCGYVHNVSSGLNPTVNRKDCIGQKFSQRFNVPLMSGPVTSPPAFMSGPVTSRPAPACESSLSFHGLPFEAV